MYVYSIRFAIHQQPFHCASRSPSNPFNPTQWKGIRETARAGVDRVIRRRAKGRKQREQGKRRASVSIRLKGGRGAMESIAPRGATGEGEQEGGREKGKESLGARKDGGCRRERAFRGREGEEESDAEKGDERGEKNGAGPIRL